MTFVVLYMYISTSYSRGASYAPSIYFDGVLFYGGKYVKDFFTHR